MPKKLVSNRQVKLFQNLTDQVRESLGREVKVFVGSGIPGVLGGFDPVNGEPLDPNEPMTYDDDVYIIEKAIVRWTGENAEYEFLSGGRVAPGDVFIKCRLEDVLLSGVDINNETVFDHARKIIVDGRTVKVAQTPRKTGLRDLYSLEVWCKLVDME